MSNETQLDATDTEIDGIRATFALTATLNVHLRNRRRGRRTTVRLHTLKPGVLPAPWSRREHDVPTAQVLRANVDHRIPTPPPP